MNYLGEKKRIFLYKQQYIHAVSMLPTIKEENMERINMGHLERVTT